RAFVAVGMLAHANAVPAQRLAVAVLVPTRVLAAALGALGCVLRGLGEESRVGTMALAERFEYLAGLPVGTPLAVRQGRRVLRGVLRGISEDIDGQRRLVIQLESEEAGGLTTKLPMTQIHRVSVEDSSKPLPKKQTGRTLREAGNEPLAALFPHIASA